MLSESLLTKIMHRFGMTSDLKLYFSMYYFLKLFVPKECLENTVPRAVSDSTNSGYLKTQGHTGTILSVLGGVT